MKKEYLILAALIICLSAYLFFRNEGRDNYTLPETPKIDAQQVTAVLIEKKDQQIRLSKKDKTWVVSDNAYPADKSTVDSMLDSISRFKLTTLVSQKSDLKRYQLDPENRIQVTASVNGKETFTFTIGKEAPTGNHTFVMIASDTNIYHAAGSFGYDFDQDIESLRDKMVLRVTAPAVKQVSVSKDSISKTVIAKEEKDDKGKTTTRWSDQDDKPVAKTMVDGFIASLSYLKCDTYPQTQTKNEFNDKTPMLVIDVAEQEKKTLRLYKGDDDKTVYGISSMNDYLFTFSEYDAQQIIDSVDQFLGIEKKEEEN